MDKRMDCLLYTSFAEAENTPFGKPQLPIHDGIQEKDVYKRQVYELEAGNAFNRPCRFSDAG